MNVVFLGPVESGVYRHLLDCGDHVVQVADRITKEQLAGQGTDFVVSHGYRHIVRRDVISLFAPTIINLHISLLPWNRGADPNLWSFLENTPAGVSIHVMDEGVDTGPLLVQQAVEFGPEETLRSSYDRLQSVLLDLFKRHWPDLRAGRVPARAQHGPGTVHRVVDKEPYLHLLRARGWDTPVSELRGRAVRL